MYNSVKTADTNCIEVNYKGIKLYKLYEEPRVTCLNFNTDKFSLYKYIKM